MGVAETNLHLHDFLYRDPARIASYYAQLCGGHLSSVEITEGAKDSSESSGGGSLGFAKGELKSAREASDGRKEVLSPHDILITDLVARLVRDGRVHNDHSHAASGCIVRAKGTLYFLDGSIIKVGLAAIEQGMGIPEIEGKPSKAERRSVKDAKETRSAMKMAKAAFSAMQIPSVFVVEDEEGSVLAGTIKEQGLDEPISAFHFKHGDKGLPGIEVIGIKEGSAPILEDATSEAMFHATKELARQLGRMVIPENSTRVTPLTIYRRI